MEEKSSMHPAVMALCGTMAAGAADYTILEKADKVETTVYGTTQTGSLNDRIAALDKLLNGQSTVSGSLQDKTNALYKDVYGNSGSDLSLLTAVNLMQWQYSGQITDEPLLVRIESLEQSIDGKTMSGSLEGRVLALRRTLLGNKKYVSQTVTIPANTLVTMTNIDASTRRPFRKATSSALPWLMISASATSSPFPAAWKRRGPSPRPGSPAALARTAKSKSPMTTSALPTVRP